MRVLVLTLASLFGLAAVPIADAAPEGCIPLTDNSDKLCYDTRPLSACYYRWANDPDPMCFP